MGRWPGWRTWLRRGWIFGLCCAAGCAGSRLGPKTAAVPERTASATINGASLTLHLAGHAVAGRPLVLYASGDGGWFGAAPAMFRSIAAAGYPVVGISARAFLRDARAYHRPLTTAAIVEDYLEILARARTALGVAPDVRVVLSGWSRGASLAVLVGVERRADPLMAGVIAMGLTADERLEVDADSDDDETLTPGGTPGSIDLYPLIPSMAPVRCVVIQATRDGYLPADRARVLFGADTPQRRFVSVTAKDHRFSGGEAAFGAALDRALAWLAEPVGAEWPRQSDGVTGASHAP